MATPVDLERRAVTLWTQSLAKAGPGAPGRHPRVLVTSGFPSELVPTPFSGQASRAGLDTYLWRGRAVLPVLNLRNQSKPGTVLWTQSASDRLP